MSVELKPCPFCGGEAQIERMGTPRESMIISCTICGCSLETGEEWLNENIAWNRRKTSDAAAKVRAAALREAADKCKHIYEMSNGTEAHASMAAMMCVVAIEALAQKPQQTPTPQHPPTIWTDDDINDYDE